MKPVDLLKIKWLLLHINSLEHEEKTVLLRIIDKCYVNLAQVPQASWELIDKIYQKLRGLLKSQKSGEAA